MRLMYMYWLVMELGLIVLHASVEVVVFADLALKLGHLLHRQ